MSLAEQGKPELPVSIHSPGNIAGTEEQAIEEMWPCYLESFGRIGRERGWGETSKDHFVSEVRYGSMYVGSPEKVAAKIVHALRSVSASRFDLKYANGTMPHAKLMNTIRLYAEEVAPIVRAELAKD
jgi:hypothetical protein